MKALFQSTLLSTPGLLKAYMRGCPPKLDEIQRIVFLAVRHQNTHWPDYRFKAYDGQIYRDFSLPGLLGSCLRELAEYYFCFRHHMLWIKPERYASWQRLLTRQPPLPLMAAAMLDPAGERAKENLRLKRNFQTVSCLPSLYHPFLEEMIREEGLSDLHIHLNGTTEFDSLWQDALQQPDTFYFSFRQAFRDQPQEINELYAQIDPDLRAEDLRIMLHVARYCRERMLFDLNGETKTIPWQTLFDPFRQGDLKVRLPHPRESHPLQQLKPRTSDLTVYACEATMLVEVYRRLQDETKGEGSGQLAALLHLYLLIQACLNRLLVQQTDQKGFDQFQKITFNEIRRVPEQSYTKRYHQLEGRYGQEDLVFLEGRFAPNQRGAKTYKTLRSIIRGYQKYQREDASCDEGLRRKQGVYCDEGLRRKQGGSCDEGPRRMELGLVGHLIKNPADETIEIRADGTSLAKKFTLCRHYGLRGRLIRAVRVLREMCNKLKEVRQYLTGLDAASNEGHTPPEVFAPAYRAFKRGGHEHRTYHAGEDFVHLISGIRTVWEAVTYLDLSQGDRIGHATALGIDPRLWIERGGASQILMKRGDRLDDLLFTYMLLSDRGRYKLNMIDLTEKIRSLFAEIYQSETPADLGTMITAYRLRHLDARLMKEELGRIRDGGARFLDRDRQEEAQLLEEAQKRTPQAFGLFRDYHSEEVFRRSAEQIEVPIGHLSVKALTALQARVIEEMNQRTVAIESLPTSNVVISFYHNYKEHHLFRWLGLTGPKLPKPLVVLGSDDPGIFANNLRNEFAWIFQTLVDDYKLSHQEAMTHLRALNRNGRTFRFRTNEDPKPWRNQDPLFP